MKIPSCNEKLKGTWIDIGAGEGHYLKFMSDKSYGLDINELPEKKIYTWNFNELPRLTDIGVADVLWCSNLFEHVLRPHEFLMNIKQLIKSDGILIIAVPNTSLFNKGPFSGTLQGDHVNFFTNSTLKLTIEFAGYEIVYSGTSSLPKFGKILAKFGPTLMVVARPNHNFQYSDGAHKLITPKGIIFKSESIGH
jgi:SAM-dependent methyltransferase